VKKALKKFKDHKIDLNYQLTIKKMKEIRNMINKGSLKTENILPLFHINNKESINNNKNNYIC